MEITLVKKNPTLDYIIDNLWLGCIDSVEIANEIGITNIINISGSVYLRKDNITYYDILIPDDRNQDISKYFESSTEFILSSEKVLVHCANSVSRSVTLVLYYLMKLHKMTLKDSILYLKSKRTQYVKPNIGFIKQLLVVELELFDSNSTTLLEIHSEKI